MNWEIIRTIVEVAAISVGLPTIIAWFLNRKGANKKLQIEAGGLEVTEFQAMREAFNDLLREQKEATASAQKAAAAAQTAADNAITEIANYKAERQKLLDTVEEQGTKLDRLRTLFMRVIRRNSIELTEAEQLEFESTKPRPHFGETAL